MLKIFDELKSILDKPLIDINAKNIDYDNVILFELDEIIKNRTVTTRCNVYNLLVNLYFITKENDPDHSKNCLNILKTLELHHATAIKKITYSQLIIINASKFFVSKFELVFENFTPN